MQAVRFAMLLWGVSEAVMGVVKRRVGASHDRGSMLVLFVGFTAACMGGFVLAAMHLAPMPVAARATRAIAVLMFVAGLALRWWAILVLGRQFTFDVQIAADHELVRRGPYRVVRHPSYTGLLLIMTALGLALEDWIALAAVALITVTVLAYRIRVEENALRGAFGARWDEYVRETWRLVPLVF
ncbi:MAG TPA: isoprenylcysteine carboxylmethyltransferase family protein [Thermoanaerobaculia bacterium]|nr:isoprenylcysteine carboxylmethyltransferase family protein [Thermoanaerobaculia bacterium]